MKEFYRRICQAEVILAGASFAISCLIIFASAIARSINRPFNWAQDLSLFLFAWSVFFSADASLRAGKLVRVELLVSRFSPRTQKVIEIFNYLIILVFLGALAWYGVKLSVFSWRRTFQGIPGFSYGWVTLSLPFGSMLLGTTTILKLKGLLTFLRQPDPKSEF